MSPRVTALSEVAASVLIDAAAVTPARRARGSESMEGLGGLSPGDLTAIQCKNVPDYLNDRTVLEKHFGQFVKVRRVMTRRNKKMAIIHFFDHVSIGSGWHKDRFKSECLGMGAVRTASLW